MKPEIEEVVAMDSEKGALLVHPRPGATTVRLALRRGDQLVYVTYERTNERDAKGRPIYR